MKHLYYTIFCICISFILLIYIYKHFRPIEGMEQKDAELWKNNHHNMILLKKKFDAIESLEYIRKNNPELLGERVDDKSLSLDDVVKYFKNGIEENELLLAEVVERAENAIPKEENINITGV